ncbi:MAG: hypothetical protein ABGY71_11715 [bacterium]|jgi:hypothetical protein|nr:hypothetical protein [Planctomycetota bacterium]HIL52904.1 hypothetical protein [Planctomycetota bacterium]
MTQIELGATRVTPFGGTAQSAVQSLYSPSESHSVYDDRPIRHLAITLAIGSGGIESDST